MPFRLCLVLCVAGCTPPPCASSVACGQNQVCGLDGRCGPLAQRTAARFAAARWIAARDWAISARARRPRSDVFPLGGSEGAEGLLAFGPLPAQGRILQALLVLHPYEGENRVADPIEIVVERVEPFRGGVLPPRQTVGPLEFAAARSALAEGPARPIRIDVSASVREAATRRDRMLYVLLRVHGGGEVSFASPWALGERNQPRLELLLH